MLRKYVFKAECVCDAFVLCSEFHICFKLILTRVVRSKNEHSDFLRGASKMRNICLVGDTDCAKSFLFKGLRGLFEVYERPEGGSHQLHDTHSHTQSYHTLVSKFSTGVMFLIHTTGIVKTLVSLQQLPHIHGKL